MQDAFAMSNNGQCDENYRAYSINCGGHVQSRTVEQLDCVETNKERDMKKSVCLLLLGLIGLAHAAGPELRDRAICDQRAGFCVDRMGVSLALTKIYLGDAAEAKLLTLIKETDKKDYDPTRFTMSDGLTCHTEEKQCWTTQMRDKPDRKATQTLFGQ